MDFFIGWIKIYVASAQVNLLCDYSSYERVWCSEIKLFIKPFIWKSRLLHWLDDKTTGDRVTQLVSPRTELDPESICFVFVCLLFVGLFPASSPPPGPPTCACGQNQFILVKTTFCRAWPSAFDILLAIWYQSTLFIGSGIDFIRNLVEQYKCWWVWFGEIFFF